MDCHEMEVLLRQLGLPRIERVLDYGGSWHVRFEREPNRQEIQRLQDAGLRAAATVEWYWWRILKADT
jgi:hypothetical protein